MDYEIRAVDKRTVAGFHLVGPWDEKVKQGFQQLMLWVNDKQIVPQEWIAVYYDNPDEVPAEKLRSSTFVSVPEGFTIPENSEGVILSEMEGGTFATMVVRIQNDDYATPWHQFFTALMQDKEWEMACKPSYEVYLNNGEIDGYWDIEMCIPVQPAAK